MDTTRPEQSARRWDRTELTTLVDDLLNMAAALEQWLSGSGISGTLPGNDDRAPALLPPVPRPRQYDLSSSELAHIVGIAASTVSQWCRQGTLANCYMVPASRSPNGKWMIPFTEARKAASFASELRTANPRLTDRSVSILTAKHLRSTKGLPPLGRKDRIRAGDSTPTTPAA